MRTVETRHAAKPQVSAQIDPAIWRDHGPQISYWSASKSEPTHVSGMMWNSRRLGV
jgi:hypothetical protein